MRRKRYALHLQSDAAADFDINQRERKRDAALAVQNFVEKAVARIVVIRGVAGEAVLIKQKTVERNDGIGRADVGTQPTLERRGHLVEPRQIRCDVEIGILLARDQQRGFGQIDLFVRAGDNLPETLGLRRHARLASGRFSSRFCGFMRNR